MILLNKFCLVSSLVVLYKMIGFFNSVVYLGWFPSAYTSTLANSTLLISFSEMLKFSKFYFFQIKKPIVNDNPEYLGIFHLLK
jgi:hypothetical protein